MSEDIRVKPERLVALVHDALAAEGVPAAVCSVEAEVMAEADWLGVPSHGVRMLPGLIRGFREGRANRNPRLHLLRDRAATCVLDGDNGPGRYLSVCAMQQAVGKSKSFGVGICLATRTTHWGRAHSYAGRAARAGMIGICTTNAIPNMLAWGSAQPLLGNNPLAIAVPRGESKDPIVLDMAMSQAALGKIGTYLREGKTIPLNWGLDASGRPTVDPETVLSSRNILPMGDHKGAGLALMMELLTGALAGAMLSHEVAQIDSTGLDPNTSKLFLALDVEVFEERSRFEQKVEQMLAYLRDTEDGRNILYPGERGWQIRDQYREEGIPIHPAIVEQLQGILDFR
jgi:LDH2 family malate/lactate/ureidoglycolate dehydrogenase